MAVQAHCSPNPFMPDFRKRPRNALIADLQQYNEFTFRSVVLGGGFNFHYCGQNLNGNTVFSDPESDLTCYLPDTKKRNRGDSEQMNLMTPEQQLRLLATNSTSMPKVQEKLGIPSMAMAKTISTELHLSHQEARMNQSDATSTSGRYPQSQDVVASLYQQHNSEIDALIRLQNERLRLALEEKRKTHYVSVLSLLEQQVGKKLREKDMELQNARTRNAELEETVRQMCAENQLWQNVARNNEAMVANLKGNLEKVLLQGASGLQIRPEGYGDSEVLLSPAAAADDAQSCCFFEGVDMDDGQSKMEATHNEEFRRRRMCRVCRAVETAVLLLPCRHLCLCKECDSRIESCPVCSAHKSASLQVYM